MYIFLRKLIDKYCSFVGGNFLNGEETFAFIRDIYIISKGFRFENLDLSNKMEF